MACFGLRIDFLTVVQVVFRQVDGQLLLWVSDVFHPADML